MEMGIVELQFYLDEIAEIAACVLPEFPPIEEKKLCIIQIVQIVTFPHWSDSWHGRRSYTRKLSIRKVPDLDSIRARLVEAV
ncbi:hypothetical protein MKW98_026128 [Papaver atlanticum]|uniref:Uncharacterized protein n=1 Tax=Papaver atlanticum TaxID=357466 RepID=A0AAD4RY39_9MAGN|nr:hypothetical protein MKW98_026128 [Papaver atlanticum]